MNANQAIKECPICMDDITPNCNLVVTECGHTFHCSCLMRNTAINGFGCPYCRNTMAEEPEPSVQSDPYYDSDEEEEEIFEENALTSFRMFWQQINNSEVEEEPEEDDDWESVEEEETEGPDSAYITAKLMEKGVTMEDLVKSLLYNDMRFDSSDRYEEISNQVFGKMMSTIRSYRPVVTTQQTETQQTVAQQETSIATTTNIQAKVEPPLIAESKTRNNARRLELIN